jgi:hypothetical protein
MDRAQAGILGHAAMVRNTTRLQRLKWARMGGRKRNPTWDELQAATRPRKRASATSTTGGSHVETTSSSGEGREHLGMRPPRAR